jgi:hypothetical protein
MVLVSELHREAASADRSFQAHCLNRDITNLALLKYRNWQGFLITGQHSGTHWIKWMLSHAIASQYSVAPPRYINNSSSNEIIGHPKHKRIHSILPKIASSHSIPPYVLDIPWIRRIFTFPPYGLVVRNIRDVLISNYEKWQHKYDVPFSIYLSGDPAGKSYVCDIWWYIHFLNRWGEVKTRFPTETLVIRYEDFQADSYGALDRLARHFSLELSSGALAVGAAAGDRKVMALHQDPTISEQPIRPASALSVAFSEADDLLLRTILQSNLNHDFGYGYCRTPRGFQGSNN